MTGTVTQKEKSTMPSTPSSHYSGPIKSSTVKRGAVWSSKILPPQEAGAILRDDYSHLGDAYNRNQESANEWEIKNAGIDNMPYLAHIKSLAPTWRTLRYLSDWMEVGTTPLRWTEMNEPDDPGERARRIEKTVVTFIEYQPAAQPKSQEIRSSAVLRDTLNSFSHEPHMEPPMRLLIVEDLSREVIEILGSRFDIDPMCFREQVDDYVWHNVRDPWAQPPSLMSSMKHRNWFRVRNMRLRYHETRKDFEAAWLEANGWNVQRRPDNDENQWNYSDKDGAVVSIMRTRTSVWVGKDKQCGNGTVGILFVDPTSTHGTPLWYDRSNWLPLPKMNATTHPGSTQSVSWYKDIINATRAFPWFEIADHHEINPQVLVKPILFTICAEWLIVCDYVRARLSQIERGLQMPRVFYAKGKGRPLKRLHMWRRQIPIFREMITETLEQAIPSAARLTSPNPASSVVPNSPLSTIDRRSIITDTRIINFDDVTGYEDIIPDFRRVLEAINDLQERVDRLTPIVTSEIGIQDSRRNLVEAHNSSRLTLLATIFVPLSLISSIYSMTEDISTMRTTVGWYFATAIPCTAIVMAALWFMKWKAEKNPPSEEDD
ncbi:hypothetical protein CC86DRAFT_340739 [Ophiobolus disseminans]|uniref:Cora-domain-containing protein n=1 Tax=Ophiobolus disseminans TaxID=1469910 RepID=A0A6A7AIA1_9PLEO|nr:hypothetical protein CC86DRAFT_340739 [Ophiobolus disseminans]